MKLRKPIIFFRGQKFIVECAIREDGSSDSKAFLDSMDIKKRAKIVKLIERFADFGVIHNKEQFKKVEGKIWEFKHFQTRILMYHCAIQCIALTTGFFKKGNKIPKTKIDRANQIMNEYNKIREGMKNDE